MYVRRQSYIPTVLLPRSPCDKHGKRKPSGRQHVEHLYIWQITDPNVLTKIIQGIYIRDLYDIAHVAGRKP